MPTQTTHQPTATVEEQVALTALQAEPEMPLGDPPLYTPPTGLLLAVVLSPTTPKEPKRK